MIPADSFSFTLPTRVRFGEGEVQALAPEARALGMARPLFVTDSTLGQTEACQRAVNDCRAAGLEVEVWEGVVPNPTDTSVYEGLRAYREAGCDGLIGFGGGSSIDTAKAIGVLANGTRPELEAYFHPDPVPVAPLPPLIAMPTTAGTGSEVTWVSVITRSDTGTKAVIRDRALYPAISLVDPVLTYSMPPRLTAYTALDAFSHAVETYTSARFAPLSEPLVLRSMELIIANLPCAVQDGRDRAARRGVSLAATMAGVAFTNGMLHTGHHISHVLTGRYHLPHGLACILTIPAMLAYLRPVREAKIARLAPFFGGPPVDGVAEQAVAAIEGLRQFMAQVGVPTIEEATGEKAAAIPSIVAGIVAHGPNPFSPREMDAAAYTWILERTFETGASLVGWPGD